MRTTRTWTISLPPGMSKLAQEVARADHRTKSELVREALRLYMAQRWQRGTSANEPLALAEDLAAVYRARHAAAGPSEAELREQFKPIRRLHQRLKKMQA